MYALESFAPDLSTPSTTLYLANLESFMRHLATSAFKIAGGVSTDSGSGMLRATQQNIVPPAFTSKITKAFLDAIYAVLDGFVVLVAEEAPPGVGSIVAAGAPEREGKQELIDLRDSVRSFSCSTIMAPDIVMHQEYEAAPRDIQFLTIIRIVDTQYVISAGECARHIS